MSDTLDKANRNEVLPSLNPGESGASEATVVSEPREPDPVETVAAHPGTAKEKTVSPRAEVADDQPEPPAESAESKFADPVVGALGKLNHDVRELHDLLAAAQTRLSNLEATMDTTAKQVAFLPSQVRMLGGRIDGLATVISETRYRAVLLSLLGVYDLVDQVLRTLPPTWQSERDVEHRRNYEVLRTQLRQILEANGLSEISTDGVFDPEVHRALRRAPVDDPALAGHVLKVVRPGFRTEHSVLRYAEVLVADYVAAEKSVDEGRMAGDDSGTKP